MSPAPAALGIALLSAAVMGMAIQRGATCMVAAVDDALVHRRYGRAGALAEAALWVAGLLAAIAAAGWAIPAVAHFPITAFTVAGGMLLGLGAWINRACVFGSVARLGSGQSAWLATPVGFFLGCLIPLSGPEPGLKHAPFAYPLLVALFFAVLVLVRLLETGRSGNVFAHWWHPHRATLLIGVTFVSTMLAVGMWAYTDALAALAKQGTAMDARLALRGLMVVALFAGAVLGGRVSGTQRWERPQLPAVARCLAGGALMGMGAGFVPGSNDGLIMLGLPLLMPHAWVAVAVMAATIAAAIGLSKVVGQPARA